jgi:hypothetical protein
VVGGAFLVLLTMATAIEPLPLPAAEIDPRPAHPYLFTALQESLVLGLGGVWYWRHPSKNSGELDFTWSDWNAKLFSTRDISFDSDLFSTNAIAHPMAGALYYQIARGNGLSPLASVVATVLVSTAWEYLVEWDERPSINDLIFTPAGGVVLGEATYRLGRMFAAGTPSVGSCLGALVFAPVATLNRTPVCRGGRLRPTDDFGLPSETWHRLTFNAGQSYTSFDGGPADTAMDLGFAAQVVDHPGYRRGGRAVSAVSPGDWTAFSTGALINHAGLRGLEIHADGTWWGRYRRDYAPTDEVSSRATDGWGGMLGLGSTFDYDARDVQIGWDRVATVGLLGPLLEYASRYGDLKARATLGAQYGFSMVTSLAYPAARAAFTSQIIKTTLDEQGYYYAQSVTGAATASLIDEPLGIYVRARFGAFWSIDRGDRYQSQLTDNFSLHDQRLHLRIAASLRILGGPVRLLGAFDQVNRASHLPGFSFDGTERRGSVSAQALF